MKLLILSSLYRTTPVSGAGSIENFVHDLSNILVSQYKHDVTVISKKGSVGGVYKTVHADFDDFRSVLLNEVKNNKPDLIHLHFEDSILAQSLAELSPYCDVWYGLYEHIGGRISELQAALAGQET